MSVSDTRCIVYNFHAESVSLSDRPDITVMVDWA